MIPSCCGPKTYTPSPHEDMWYAELEKKKREMYNRLDRGKYEDDAVIRSKLSPSEFPVWFTASPRSKSTMEEINLHSSEEYALPSPEDLRAFLGVSPSILSPTVSPSSSLTPRSPRDIPQSEAIWISEALRTTKLDLAIHVRRERLSDRDVKQGVTRAGTSVFVRCSEEEPAEEFVLLEDTGQVSQSVPALTKNRWQLRTRSETGLSDGSKRRLCGFA